MTRLELTWPGKDRFLLVPKDEQGKPVWVDRDHPAASEVRVSDFIGSVGEVNESDEHADNLLFTGDSLDVLRILAEVPEYRRLYRGKVRLVYIDPPFNTGQAFEHYDDWMEHATWLSFMRDRLLTIQDLLSPDGTIWVHLDNFEVHRMRVLMDEVFGADQFINQVTWKRTQGKSSARRGMGAMADYLLVYGASPTSSLRPVRLPLTEKHLATEYRHSDERGRFMLGDLSAPGTRAGDSGEAWKGRMPPGRGRHWAAPTVDGVTSGDAVSLPTRDRLDLLDEAGLIYWPTGEKSVPKFKRYLTEESGVAVSDLWDDIQRVPNSSKERVGYDTQKPERLLERVIAMSTDPGNIVLDCFAGSGTTAAVAHKMGRRWITADILPATIETFTAPRLRSVIAGHDPGGVTETFNWAGGGGFRTVEVGPSMYEHTPFGVMLSEAATNGAFSRAMAGQLGYEYQDDAPLCGRRGQMRLAVVDGAVGSEGVSQIAAALSDGERVTIVAKAVLDGAEEALNALPKGCRIEKAPRDVLAPAAMRMRRRMERGSSE